MVRYSPRELEFIEKHSNLIEARDIQNLLSIIWSHDPGSLISWGGEPAARKMTFLVAYVILGPKSFRLRLEDRGKSRSLHRANSGQKILRFCLDVVLGNGASEFFPITYMKGTMNPENITWGLLFSPLQKTIQNISGGSFLDVMDHLREEWKLTGGKYSV